MAGYQRCISLAVVCLLLCHDSLAGKSMPCISHSTQQQFDNFIDNHVRDGAPETDDAKEWYKFLGEPDPKRPTQSFLKYSDLASVEAVCSNKGGRQYSSGTDKCISKQEFTYFTVRKNIFSGPVYYVKKEIKHLILSCNKVNNKCRPTHFEANKQDKPDDRAKGCQGGPP